MKLLLLGATGLVGGHVLDLAIADARIDDVIAPVRRPLPPRPGLIAPRVDFDRLPEDAGWWRADYEYPMQAARLARRHGTPVFVLNSAMGADPDARFFYSRVKGELERDLQAVGFDSLTFARPGLIGGERGEFRLGERVAGAVLGAVGPALPRRWRINPADRIALAMIDAAVEAEPGIGVLDAEGPGSSDWSRSSS